MRLYVIRHGQTDANVQGVLQGPRIDLPLNARGRAEARALARWFESRPVDHILSSPLKRARETAEAVAAVTRAPVTFHDELVEMDWGVYMGRENTGEIHDAMNHYLGRWSAGDHDAAPPQGESPVVVASRVRRALARELASFEVAVPNGALAVVAHGRLNKVLLALLVHGDLATMESFGQGNAGVTVLDGAYRARPRVDRDEGADGGSTRARVDAPDSLGSWQARMVNGVEHLSGLASNGAESE